MTGISRRRLIAATGTALGLGALAGVGLGRSSEPARPRLAAAGDGMLADASGLDPVRVVRHVTLTARPDEALIATLRAEIAEAKTAGRSIVASAARHSMGNHSLAEGGTAVTLDQPFVEIDTGAGRYRAAAGARWNQAIAALDARGFSPAVMQSNNDFGVASTFSVNAHGWPVPFGPFGETVRSFRMLLASGELVECTRESEPELFAATMGGYGLTGLIVDLDVDMVKNERLEPAHESMPAAAFAAALRRAVDDPAVRMAYGRLDVSIDGFFEEALLFAYRPAADQSDIPAASGSGMLSRASRVIFRNQVGSERWKALRWGIETGIGASLAGEATRNSLLNEPVVTLDDQDPGRTDILHEYFVPFGRFADFAAACRAIIPGSYQELLNVTLRYVAADRTSILRYAGEDRIAAVMLFSQEMSERGEGDMKRMTGALIEAAMGLGGAYYLPYRPHATLDQFRRCYPRHGELLAVKRRVDPDGLFSNRFFERYLAEEATGA